MFERPAPHVLAHGAVHRFAADDVVAQGQKNRRGFPIAHGGEPLQIDAVGRRHDGRLPSVVDGGAPIRQVPREGVGAGGATLGGKRVLVRVDSLVHPGVAPLVRADDHRKPLVPLLVVDRRERRRGIGRAVSRHHEHRVLHAVDGAGDTRRLWVRVSHPESRVRANRPLRLFGGRLPGTPGFWKLV
jgi:hypothetical protein